MFSSIIFLSGSFFTVAGSGESGYADGFGTNAKFYFPYELAVCSAGNVFVTDLYFPGVRKIVSSGFSSDFSLSVFVQVKYLWWSGEVTTLVGNSVGGIKDGVGTLASFKQPYGLTFNHVGDLFVVDFYNVVRKISSSCE